MREVNGTTMSKSYFKWMMDLIEGPGEYKKLLHSLHKIDFVYINEMDANRQHDGLDLRYRFGYEKDILQENIASTIDDNRPCSVLEMMVALAFRCEESIMTNPEIGDRTGIWFWDMIQSLGLNIMTDKVFNQKYVDEFVDIFLNREYESNGSGGLFTIDNPKEDMRNVEIWYQMFAYLDKFN